MKVPFVNTCYVLRNIFDKMWLFQVEASTKYGVVLYFTKEYATLQFGGIINTSSYFLIRRLSTASFAKDNAPLKFGSFHTQWRWYYENDYGQWMLYDKVML